MELVYEYKNAVLRVRSIDTYDREKFKKATEIFLRRVIEEEQTNGNSNTSGDFREKQILHR